MKTFRNASASHGSSHDSSHGIDLAPMLDFVMNLLIFFIITAIFIKEVGIEMARPSGTGETSATINIRVLENGDVVFGDRTIAMRAVRANVEREIAAQPELGITVMADNGAATGAVLGVVDQVRLGGIDNITFVTAAPQ